MAVENTKLPKSQPVVTKQLSIEKQRIITTGMEQWSAIANTIVAEWKPKKQRMSTDG